MTGPSDALTLAARLALLSSISFGGFPTVLPDVREFVVISHGWLTDQEFSNLFALAQAIPGPNMILMMSFVGWRVWGLPGAIASAVATFGPPCTIYFSSYCVWDRFHETQWQDIVRSGLVPVTLGLVIASGVVMAGASYTGFAALLVTLCAALLMLLTRINPLWMLLGGGILGALDLL